MNPVARLSLTALAVAASVVSASPAFANHGGPHRQLVALHGEGHWEHGFGPRGTSHWVINASHHDGQTMDVAMHKAGPTTHKSG
jgi:hypothetical protein